jgi:YqaJ-like viral recombinase domain
MMTLNAAYAAQRAGKLTASRVAVLMTGDAAGILELYEEMIGVRLPEDLSDIWPVQLGLVTEPLNLRWFAKKNYPLSRHGEFVIHPRHSWAACTLDAWCDELACPVEAKHVGGREPIEVIIDRYQPQLQWQMEVCEASQAAISIIAGANEPIVEFIDRDEAYANEMIARGRQFMSFVERRVPPVVLPAVPAPIDANRIYDMTGQNQWASSAASWFEHRTSAELCADAVKILKSLVPPDAKKCFGHGVQITRDRANRLSLREQPQ